MEELYLKRPSWLFLFGAALVGLSIILYIFHYFIFYDVHHIFIYMIGDIAFLPIEVLLVTLIIHRLLVMREKRERLDKLNMVIGAFFSEVGTQLLAYFSDCDPELDKIREDLIVSSEWTDQDFFVITERLKHHSYQVDMNMVDLEGLRAFLVKKRDFLVRLLENPVLLEHETFTPLLRAVFHLTEELIQRGDVTGLPKTDLEHLAGDIRRGYTLLITDWLAYMKHLKNNYPFLFSLSMRTNPFDQKATIIVK